MAFTSNKLSVSRKQKEPLQFVSALNGAVPVAGKITDTEEKGKCAVGLLAAVPIYSNLERTRKKLSAIQASSPETSGSMNALEEAKNIVALFERLYGNAETGAHGLSHGRKIKDNAYLQDVITSLKNKTKKSKKQEEDDGLGDKWIKTVPILRVCTDGKLKGPIIDEEEPYGDENHQNETSCFGGAISADEIPYIVLPGAEEENDDRKDKIQRFRYSLGVIVRKKINKKIDNNDDYLFCVVAETGPARIKAKSLVREETLKNMSSSEQNRSVRNTLGEVSIYAAWILKGLDVSSIKNIRKKTTKNNKYMIGNDSVEIKDTEYKIIIFQKSAPEGGWCYNKNAKKFRQQIVERGEYILKTYNNSIKNTKKSQITGNCLNLEKPTNKKPTIKKALKKITAFCLFALLLAGCQKPATKEPENVDVNEETVQPAITVPEKQEPVQAKEKKLSEIYDWENARIMDCRYSLDFGEGQVLQNQDYVFYPEDGFKIACISKADGSKKIIYRSNPVKKENISIHYCLSDDRLFIEYNGNVYSCGFDGKNLHKIISRKKLKKQVTAIEPGAWYYGNADALKFHQGSLYLSIGNFIWKLDLKTKKITKMSEEVNEACFCGSTLYYTNLRGSDHSLYKTNTHTGKISLVTKKKCDALTETDGKLYYVHYRDVYMYRKGKKDKKIFSFEKKLNISTIFSIMSDSGKIAVNYLKDKRYHEGTIPELSSVAIYDTRTSAFSKIENIPNYNDSVYFTGDMLFYSPKSWNYGGYLSFLSYPQPARDKTFKITKENITQPGSTEYTLQESQEEKLSNKYDWDSAKITNDYYDLSGPDFGDGPVLQNENYIFYPENGCKIIRINKKDKTVKVVCSFDPAKKKHELTYIRFCLSDSRLFISYVGSIYSCDFEGENLHKILSRKKLGKQTIRWCKFFRQHGWWQADIYAMRFHKGSLYLSSEMSCIYRLDLETKKVTKISDYSHTTNGCLCGNTLYYAGDNGYSLYRADTHTGKRTLIKDTDRCIVTEAGGKPYYLEYSTWEKATIYMYRKGKKDKKIWDSDIAISESCCAPGKIAMRYYSSQKYDSRDNNVLIYDIKTSTITKIENIPDFDALVCLSGDMLFYEKSRASKYLSYIAY